MIAFIARHLIPRRSTAATGATVLHRDVASSGVEPAKAAVAYRSPQPVSSDPSIGVIGGAAFGLLAAVLYTGANVALRGSVNINPFLVSAVKAAPTVICLTPLLAWMWARQKTLYTSLAMAPRFMLVALIGQFIGNAAFQWALGSIGLAASVPITLGTLLIGGAILGRVILGEPVRARSMIAILVLIAAVLVLSSPDASQIPSDSTAPIPTWMGALCAAASGAAYALFGTVMRQSMSRGLSAPLTMWISGMVGTISLWSITTVTVSGEEWSALTAQQWQTMAIAGIFNFTAFVSLSFALKALPVVAVNLINASQVAMAAIAGVILFGEPVTTSLVTGIALTFAGLCVLANRKHRRNRTSR
ncbi:DMT family transporter [Crateriforma conspicua]|uniref:EamA-like transporter family protein n=1 Tax=Crateriforma conspicua TaxID=2527996 RepID=A0A5C5XU80_9PLAN|nr:DMT family transporter [Crateriforma conspicua]QDV66175.1 EamA-like transporter family protein [Crateriforma conspicua]TWT65575.1 EamA-like transporter family protein [Crateriforma conspicua]